ncbi:hypothetical protein FACS189467_6310 [Bacteroidia bacterium]|nr:hypothetical protein FACS189467_6310 [Bacteroidia bacterium]
MHNAEAISYQWYVDTTYLGGGGLIMISGANDSTYTVTTSGRYYPFVTTSTGGSPTANEFKKVTITLCAPDPATITGYTTNTCPNTSVILTAYAPYATSYQWYKSDGTEILGATDSTYTATTGTYYVIGVNNAGQGTRSVEKTVNITSCFSVPADSICALSTAADGASGTITQTGGSNYTVRLMGTTWWMIQNADKAVTADCTYPSIDGNNYGYLYAYGCAKSACPQGWSLPTNEDFNTLSQWLTANNKWSEWNSGLSLAGYGTNGTFDTGTRDKYGYWWSNSSSNYVWHVDETATSGSFAPFDDNRLLSVRCVKNKDQCKPLQATITGSTVNTCPTESTVTLTASAENATSYHWYNYGNFINNNNSSTYVVTASGEYTVAGVNSYGEGTPSAKKDVTINQCNFDTAAITGNIVNTCPNTSVILTASAQNASSYQWYKNTNLITGATNSTYTVTATGTYFVESKNAAGITGPMSNGKAVEIIPCLVIWDAAGKDVTDSKITYSFGDTVTLTGSGAQNNGPKYEWSSSDYSVVSIIETSGLRDSVVKITANQVGQCEIKVSNTIVSGKVTLIFKEATPADIVIDYVNEFLTGVVAGESYSVDATLVTASANGIHIQESWMDDQIHHLIKTNVTPAYNSDSFFINIPSRPLALEIQDLVSGTLTDAGKVGLYRETIKGYADGYIFNNSGVTMEYRQASSGGAWTTLDHNTFNIVGCDNYDIRQKAVTDISFAGVIKDNCIIQPGYEPNRKVVISAIGSVSRGSTDIDYTFTSLTYGYGGTELPVYQDITVTNIGNLTATIYDVTTTDNAVFEVVRKTSHNKGSTDTVAIGGSQTIWQIRPKMDLSAGVYRDSVVVLYGDNSVSDTAIAIVNFTVNKRDITIVVAIKDKKYDGNTNAFYDGMPVLQGVIAGDELYVRIDTNTIKPKFASAQTGTWGISFTGDFTLIAGTGSPPDRSGNYNLTNPQPQNITAHITSGIQPAQLKISYGGNVVNDSTLTISYGDANNTYVLAASADINNELSDSAYHWSSTSTIATVNPARNAVGAITGSTTMTVQGVGTVTIQLNRAGDLTRPAASTAQVRWYVLEPTPPTPAIDYVNEKLTGLSALTSYNLGAKDRYSVGNEKNATTNATTDGSGCLDITWYIPDHSGSNTLSTLIGIHSPLADCNSRQSADFLITKRPAPPAVSGVNETILGNNDGRILNVSNTMEWKDIAGTNWTPCTDDTIRGLAAGTYNVRVAATNASFASITCTVTIVYGTQAPRILTVSSVTLDTLTYGYKTSGSKSLIITNIGTQNVRIDSVSVSKINGNAEFEIVPTIDTVVAVGGVVNSWSVQHKLKLTAGVHKARIAVHYNDRIAFDTVTFVVKKKPIKIINLYVKDKFYDGTNLAHIDTISYSPTIDSLEAYGNRVNLHNGTPTFADVNADHLQQKSINFARPDTFSIDGVDANNYVLVQPDSIKAYIYQTIANPFCFRFTAPADPYFSNTPKAAKVELDTLYQTTPNSMVFDTLYEGESGTSYQETKNPPTLMGKYKVSARVQSTSVNFNPTTNAIMVGRFEILGKDIAVPAITVEMNIADSVYTGLPHRPLPVITNGTDTLQQDIDYTLSYDNNINASFVSFYVDSMAIITISGKDNYANSRKEKFRIYRTDPAAKHFVCIPRVDTIYSGDSVLIKMASTDSIENGHEFYYTRATYTVWYEGVDGTNYSRQQNVPAAGGNYKIFVKVADGGNFNASTNDIEMGRFTICPKSIKAPNISVQFSDTIYSYTGEPVVPKPVIKNGTLTLSNLRDYTLYYSSVNNTDADNTVTVSIIGIGNYCDTISRVFNIIKANPTDSVFTYVPYPDLIYNGLPKPAEVALRTPYQGLKFDRYYVYGEGANRKRDTAAPANAGKYDVVVDVDITSTNFNGVSNLKIGDFEIKKASYAKSDFVADTTSQIYDTRPKTVSVTLRSDLVGSGTITAIFYRTPDGKQTTEPPAALGTYHIYVNVTEGNNYKDTINFRIGTFAITKTDEHTLFSWKDYVVRKPNMFILNTGKFLEQKYNVITCIWHHNDGQSAMNPDEDRVGRGFYYFNEQPFQENTLYYFTIVTSDGNLYRSSPYVVEPEQVVVSQTARLKVYPSVVKTDNKVTVETDLDASALQNAEIEVYNALGVLVKKQPIYGNQVELDLSSLPAGTYIIKVQDKTVRVVVQ